MNDWQAVFKLPWCQRDAHIEHDARTILAQRPVGLGPVSTHELAVLLAPADVTARLQIMKRLVVLAPHVGALARQDGKAFKMYGRVVHGWNWYGQSIGG
jgi:hypothetical protein